MKFKHKIAALLLSLPIFSSAAQDEIVYDQYQWNYYLVNPAVAGASRCSHILGTFKKQWVGQDDSPMIEMLSFRTRLLKNLGLGAYVYNDKNGYSLRQGGQVSLAYHIPLSQNYGYFMKDRDLQRQLSFGLSGVVTHYGFTNDLFTDENSLDNTVANGGQDKGFYFNANFGTYFMWDRFFAGLSIANLIPTELEELGKNEPVRPMNFFIFAGYTFPVNETIDIEPAAMFKMDENSNRQLDFNLKYEQVLPDNPDFSYWLQLTYRHILDEGNGQALSFSPMGGINWKGFHLGYAYTLGLTDWQRQNSGTHEVMLGYSWCKVKKFCR
ncbi:MAG: type IX secretion system membrane protein PorP/SprF [Paludibacteraceae bacterium]|nr:type IX secretion system membrane protein PorP/SprF [Paludibacteraceae bacterium]